MSTDRPFIERLELSGYKSIRHATIDLGRLNVLIGANGAGKSNLVSYFALFRASLGRSLDEYVSSHGGPNALLHLGAKRTKQITFTITVRTTVGQGVCQQRLGFRSPDGLFSSVAHVEWSDIKLFPTSFDLEAESDESLLRSQLDLQYLRMFEIYKYGFSDVSLGSPIRTECYVQDNQRLHSDAGNLAAMLFLYKAQHLAIYQRIQSTIRKVAPSFDDFVLEPQRLNPANILLNWRQVGSNDYLLGPHQFSDGTLRAMALITLLLQPEADLPDLLIIDEPELGLHPYAITIVAGLLRAVSVHTQVIVTTQSAAFLDEFTADEVIVVDSVRGESQFRRLDPSELEGWLEDYSIGELWQKNVIGGGPMS